MALNFSDYDNKLKYPTSAEASACAGRQAYRDETMRLKNKFKVDLLADADVANHPKADRAFDLAWDYGHSAGYQEVANYFDDLADLLK